MGNIEAKSGHHRLDEYELDYDYQVIWISLKEAIARNEKVKADNRIPWVNRELEFMKWLLVNEETL